MVFLKTLVALHAAAWIPFSASLNIVIPGGTGPLGRALIPKLSDHDVTVLSRNAYLASAPNRVTEAFGYLGLSFLTKNPHAKIRDWDAGNLLEIVGKDFLGWQEDTLQGADVVINLVGGYTNERTMAAERLVRESYRINRQALHMTVAPREEDVPVVTPGMLTVKLKRLADIESMVSQNLPNTACLRIEANRIEDACATIVSELTSMTASK